MQRNYKKLIQYTIDLILLILSLSISISVLQTETTYLPEYLGLFFKPINNFTNFLSFWSV